MPPFVETFRALPARSKGIIAVSAVAILAIAFLMLRIAGAPSYTLLSSGLDPAQTGKVTAALDEQGIGYELRNNGTALAVEKSQVAQARVALAGQGVSLDAGSGEGFELFDKQKLGASDFQQQVTYQRALEGEIARTISGVEGVSSPSVQLVMPQDDLFADQSTPALNADKTTREKLTYAKKGVPLKTQKETEKLTGAGSTTGGTAGTGANIPTYSQNTATGGSNSKYQRTSGTTDWGVNKQVEHSEVAPGAINKLNVALLVDKSVPPADFAAVQKAISSAAGINTARGDVLQAAQVPFAKVAAPKAGPVPASLLD